MDLSERAPVPAVHGNVRLGTAGWTDRTLVQSGLFYPRGTSSAEARLRYYATQFSVVEVDATYYALLPRTVSERWLDFTPPGFQFDIKAHPVLTGHPIDVSRLPGDLQRALADAGVQDRRVYADGLPPEIVGELERRFFDFVEPLHAGGRLGCVMLQFPPWFQATRANARRLRTYRARWPGVPTSVEVRHPSWLVADRRERLFDLMKAEQLTYVVVDEPDVPGGGVPPVIAVPRPELAIVRFHGHNTSGWRRGAPVSERFDYLYPESELAAWAPRVQDLAARAATVHAIFNNCVRNYAVVNAKGLAAILSQPASLREPGQKASP
jgi:uncharacterized protein YecE (DUF72 family)